MQLTAHPTHAAHRAARIPRRQYLAPSQEVESLLAARSSMDKLLLFAPQRAAPPQVLMFPVQYHAVGECIAHPNGPCKCIKTRPMGRSQADAWKVLGSRHKARCPLAPSDTTPGSSRPSSWPRSTIATRPVRRSSCFEARDRNAVPDPPPLSRLSSTPQEICPIGSRVAVACGPVRRTASAGTPGAAFRPSTAQAAVGGQLLLHMRALQYAQAHRAMGFQGAREGGKALPKPPGSRRVLDRAVDASG
ncbi:hypothetical protein T484DRAFT_1838543 [Baffinella frigidus]|nr:hypothetical protein T484DRAFT_1838543 [Cryptophyta sp. CCMP2293]